MRLLFSALVLVVFGLGFESVAETPKGQPPSLFEVWITKNKQNKPQYLMQGTKEMSLKRCREIFDNIAKHDPKQGVMLKFGSSVKLESVQALVKECQGAGLKSLEFLFLKEGFGASKPDRANQKKIEAWAKKAGISQHKIEDVEITEEIIIEKVGEDGGPADVPKKAPRLGRIEGRIEVPKDIPVPDDSEMEEVLDGVKTRSPLTYVGPMSERNDAGRKKTVGKYGGSKAGQDAVGRALKWLASVQNENGSWGEMKKTFAEKPGHPAHTGFAMLVFMAHGETPLSETYGKTVQKGLRWLAEYGLQQDLKTIVKKRHGAYTHGIATLALAEAYAMLKIPFLQTAMENSVDVLIDGQMKNGGFGYGYTQGERWDMSVAGWNIQALKAAKVAGSMHPKLKDAIRKSINLCKIAYGGKGGFGYASNPGNRPNMGGVGTLCIQTLGAPDDKRVQEGCTRIGSDRLKTYEEIVNDPAKWRTTGSKSLYGWYYDTQAMFNTMDKDKARWQKWRKAFETVLIRAQHKEGYWETVSHGTGPNVPGRVLSTCWAALQLEVYYRYAPVFHKRATEVIDGKKKVEKLILQLGAKPFAERKAARKELTEMGNSIRALLDEGLKTDDPEIKHALKKILKAMGDK